MEKEVETLGVPVSEDKIAEIVEQRLREEIQRGVQTIQYQVVTLMTTNGQAPFITVFMYLGEARSPQEKKTSRSSLRRRCASAIRASRTRRASGSPRPSRKLIYVLEEDNIHPDSKVLLPDASGRRMHRAAHGAGLYLREEDA